MQQSLTRPPTMAASPLHRGSKKVAPAESMAVVLFDIDGTLIRKSGPQHKEALEYAVWRVLGVRTSLEGIPTHGMLDTDLVTAMARRAGVSQKQTRDAMPALIQSAENRYTRHGPGSLARRVCPGARPLLRRLHRKGVPLLVVTGNFPRIGWKKLELAGLKEFFLDGAFAGMSPTRAGLAKLALRAARQRGWLQSDTPVALVGDSPNDIQAAHANKIRSIAVTTGINTAEELQAHQPHVLVANLAELRLKLLLGLP